MSLERIPVWKRFLAALGAPWSRCVSLESVVEWQEKQIAAMQREIEHHQKNENEAWKSASEQARMKELLHFECRRLKSELRKRQQRGPKLP